MGEDNGAGRAEGDTRPDAGFDPFYRHMYPELLRYGTALCGDRQAAHDAATSTVLEIWKRWYDIDNPEAYAKRIFPRQLFRLLKKNSRCVVTDPAELPEAGVTDTTFTEVDERMYVDQLLCRLPPKQQAVLRGLLDGRSYADLVAEEQAHRAGPVDPVRECAAKRKLAQLAKNAIRTLIRGEAESLPPVAPAGAKETR
ncbi:RNA polymerase sigma factor [Actinoplanes derwentensis]|uniref:DNA-directed RNA polymerase specialized sigma subunit, sigma24 family n=1 Tax=Actinoplanes derwentensis TaxID=113562 RepID=A0A1H1T2V8_9ACTN|nr:sigma-70 family RNA polymerase sigma factor [Actinoplanes derwentensis]GID89919.1 hypothetical protein Ade03nite_88430 [Actinoplanes derwentensis]SDS54501.1 DNA-directed RNA polymerase specialized sigma subunit, sigma24 family [Actinoplanes derwentensis]